MKLVQILFLPFVLWVAGCTTEQSKDAVQFIVKVDSISHNSFAATGDTIVIRLFGTIGGDGCHSFSHFEDIRQPLQLDLTVWGQIVPFNACPAVMVYLNGKEFRLVAIQQGWLAIRIHQPDGSVLRDSVIVK